MPIIWHDKMSAGNDRIDRDHRYLFCLINTIEFALSSDEHSDIVLTTIDQLEYYSKDHFEREETLMLKINYPKYFDQKKEHGLLISQLSEIKDKVIAVQENKDMRGIIPDLTTLLRNWLLDHVLKDDMMMKPYFNKYPKEFV
jgi:hemerythrin